MVKIGPHVGVYGPTGSGKTTVAGRIAQHIGVPYIELDAVFWMPDWVEKPLEEFRAEVSNVLKSYPDGWVLDGNYSQVRDLTLPLADTVVWLRLPFWLASWWLWRRTITRGWKKEQLWGTNYESLRLSFLSRDSLLLYQMRHWRRHHQGVKQSLEEIPHHASVFQLRSAREIEDFLASLG